MMFYQLELFIHLFIHMLQQVLSEDFHCIRARAAWSTCKTRGGDLMVKDSHEPDFRELTILWGRQVINTSIYNF